MKSVPEVSQVLSIGGDVKQFQILIDPNSLLKYGLTVSDLAAKIRSSNQNAGASFITRVEEEYIVRSTGLVITLTMGREYIPCLEEGTLHLRATLNPNISLEETISRATVIEQEIMEVPEVTGVLSRIGRGETGSHAHFVNDIEVLIQLKPMRQWEKFGNKDELITGVKAQLAVKLYGEDFDVLKEKSAEIQEVLLLMEGAADVQVEQFSGQNQIQIILDRSAIARYGLDISMIQETIEAAIGGITVGKVYEDQRRFDIFLRFRAEFRSDIDQIDELLISLPTGGRIPLGMLAEVTEVEGARVINREGNKRFITIQCNIRGMDIGRFVTRARREIDEKVSLPPEYLLKWGGQFELQQRANRTLAFITPITFVVGGLLTSTAVTLIIMPLIYQRLKGTPAAPSLVPDGTP